MVQLVENFPVLIGRLVLDMSSEQPLEDSKTPSDSLPVSNRPEDGSFLQQLARTRKCL